MNHIRKNVQSNLKHHIHKRVSNQKIAIIFTFFLLLIFSILFAIKTGAFDLSFTNILSAIFFPIDDRASMVVWNLRMPRIISAVFAGAGLSLSGLVIQTLLRNPLASPSTLGISQGAAFGASFAIIFVGFSFNKHSIGMLDSVFEWRPYLIPFCAFLGGLSVVIFIWALQKIKKTTPATVVLAGVAVSSLFVSGTILIQYFADEVEVIAAVFWSFGDVSRASWIEIWIIFFLVLLASVYFLLKSNSFNALCAGDENALGLGVDVLKFRFKGLLLATIIASFITCFNGVIAFLGLLAPHIAIKLVGRNHFYLIPTSLLLGSILLVVADTIGRVIVETSNMPVGIITSFLGAPLFLYLLLTGKSNASYK